VRLNQVIATKATSLQQKLAKSNTQHCCDKKRKTTLIKTKRKHSQKTMLSLKPY
jgi:hypothetical protein